MTEVSVDAPPENRQETGGALPADNSDESANWVISARKKGFPGAIRATAAEDGGQQRSEICWPAQSARKLAKRRSRLSRKVAHPEFLQAIKELRFRPVSWQIVLKIMSVAWPADRHYARAREGRAFLESIKSAHGLTSCWNWR
ncbi:hypothetical protein [Paraburkholderia nemoris]|uniref:hypothetical protein n=1 Tax=Paraburkholderia nemoris TaxID=2793076 RepID=UPI001B8ADD15|nr:hypothetical protein [Paraburkholderia nemoris]